MKIETQAKAVQNQEGPVLDVCWNSDGSKIFSAGADKKAMMWDLGSNQFTQGNLSRKWFDIAQI